MVTTPTTLPTLIEAYRAAETAGDEVAMGIAAESIREQNGEIMWALIDESIARRGLATLPPTDSRVRQHRNMLANALAIIANELGS